MTEASFDLAVDGCVADMLLELQGWRETTPRAKVSTQRGRCARLTDAADPKGRV
jgi:hypothetical protein